MKVNLTYQVEFDEVPLEVAHFVERAIRKSTELGQQIAALNYTPGSGIDFLNPSLYIPSGKSSRLTYN